MAIFCGQFGSLFISAIFCTYQLYIVCVQYLQYDVSTTTTLTYPTNDTPPSITVCTTSHWPLLRPFRDKLTPSLIGKLTNQSFHDRIGCLKEGQYLIMSDKMENFTASKLIKRYHVCYEYAFNSSVKFNFARSSRLLYIKLSSVTFDKLLFVHIHGSNTDISGNFNNLEFPSIIINKSRDYSFTYDHYDLHCQPYPYVTDCYDYNQIKCGTQSRCIEECINANLLKNYNHLNDQFVFRQLDNTSLYFNQYQVYRDRHERARKVCFPRFRWRPCHQQLYTHYSIPRIEPIGHGGIRYGPGYAPSTMVVYKPTMVLTDFVIYVLSTVGFWLGVAPPTILFNIQRYVVSQIATDQTNQSKRAKVNMERFISRQIKTNHELNVRLDLLNRQLVSIKKNCNSNSSRMSRVEI